VMCRSAMSRRSSPASSRLDPAPLNIYVHGMDMPIVLDSPPAIMSSRMVVMMTPDDKRVIEDRARAQGLTPSELIRRAARDYAPPGPAEAAALDLLAAEVERTVAAMRADLTRVDAEMAFHRAEMARLRGAAHEPGPVA
jgi:hypothetical protein